MANPELSIVKFTDSAAYEGHDERRKVVSARENATMLTKAHLIFLNLYVRIID